MFFSKMRIAVTFQKNRFALQRSTKKQIRATTQNYFCLLKTKTRHK